MPTYLKGTFVRHTATTGDTTTGFLWQDVNVRMTGDVVTPADSVGNVASVQYYNERLEGNITVILPEGATLPQHGAILKLTGVVAPDPDTKETSWEVSGDSADICYVYCEDPAVGQKNKDSMTHTLAIKRYLRNGLPDYTAPVTTTTTTT